MSLIALVVLFACLYLVSANFGSFRAWVPESFRDYVTVPLGSSKMATVEIVIAVSAVVLFLL